MVIFGKKLLKNIQNKYFLLWWLKFVEAFGRCALQLIILASHRKKHKSNSFVFLYTFVLYLVYNALYDRNTTNMVTRYLSVYEKCHCVANNRLILELISPLTQIIEQESHLQINFVWSVNENNIEFLVIGIEIEFVRKMIFGWLVFVEMTTFDCLPSCKILDLIKLKYLVQNHLLSSCLYGFDKW